MWIGDAEKISKFEKELQQLNRQYKIKPLLKFGGSYECFKKVKIMDKINLQRNVYEGWTPQNFIDELEPIFNMIKSGKSWQKPFKTKEELKRWCIDNQPYYKKHIPEVVNYFWGKI